MKRKLSDGAPWKIGLLIRIAGFGVGFCNAVLAVTSISFPMFLLTLPLGEIKRIFVLCFLGSTIKVRKRKKKDEKKTFDYHFFLFFVLLKVYC